MKLKFLFFGLIFISLCLSLKAKKLIQYSAAGMKSRTVHSKHITGHARLLSHLIKKQNRSSKNLHNFFTEINAEQRKLAGMGAPDADVIITGKMKNVYGGHMSIKMPDNPSPIFVTQNPFYAFI